MQHRVCQSMIQYVYQSFGSKMFNLIQTKICISEGCSKSNDNKAVFIKTEINNE